MKDGNILYKIFDSLTSPSITMFRNNFQKLALSKLLLSHLMEQWSVETK